MIADVEDIEVVTLPRNGFWVVDKSSEQPISVVEKTTPTEDRDLRASQREFRHRHIYGDRPFSDFPPPLNQHFGAQVDAWPILVAGDRKRKQSQHPVFI
jgi:hypothetical protein